MRANILRGIEHVRTGSAWGAIVSLALSLVAASARADSLQIFGYSGFLGEWELTATVRGDASSSPEKYSGPLSMKHVGLCTQEGPEERSGQINLEISGSSSRLQATLRVDGIECGYQGVLSDFYSGIMKCSGREGVPLKLWIKQSR